MRVRIEEVSDIAIIGVAWRALEPHCDASFFQSWGWVGTWLASLPAETRPMLFTAEVDAQPVGLAVVVPQKLRRHGLIASRALFLQETGRRDYDFIVEHNGILVKRGLERSVFDEFLRLLASEGGGWDEFFISGIRADDVLFDGALAERHGLRLRVLRSSSSRYVDLADLRATGCDYLSMLSSNTRYQIRRAIRRYEESGPLQLTTADSLEQAQCFFGQLKVLHQAYWTAKGESGSFARESWERFHRNLIDARFHHGEIQLIRIAAGDRVVGYLYNFVRNGWVYVLQSGFAYENDSALHPGYVCHYLAIQYNLERSAGIYDFLAGDARYKSSLARGDHPLVWVVLQRRRLKFWLEDSLRALRRLGRGVDATTRSEVVSRHSEYVSASENAYTQMSTCRGNMRTTSVDDC